jgi:hypothetical protein
MGFEDRATALVATAAKIARLQELTLDAGVLESSTASLIQTGASEDFGQTYDYYTLMLEVPIPVYVAVDGVRSELEKRIHKQIGQLTRTEPNNRVTEVVISPVMEEDFRPSSPTPEEPAIEEEEAPSFWQKGCFRVFVSHTSPNKVKAHALKQALAAYHIAAFVAHDDIEPAKQWEAEIERALRTSDALAAIMTPDFVESRWCDQEVGFAIGRGKLVVPLCSETIPHGFLGKYQSLKTKGLLATAVAQQLFDLLLENTLTSQRMTDAVVDRMANSGSFEISRRTIGLLEKVPRLSDSQVTKLIQSTESNHQVREAIGVPARIQRLVARVAKNRTASGID